MGSHLRTESPERHWDARGWFCHDSQTVSYPLNSWSITAWARSMSASAPLRPPGC